MDPCGCFGGTLTAAPLGLRLGLRIATTTLAKAAATRAHRSRTRHSGSAGCHGGGVLGGGKGGGGTGGGARGSGGGDGDGGGGGGGGEGAGEASAAAETAFVLSLLRGLARAGRFAFSVGFFSEADKSACAQVFDWLAAAEAGEAGAGSVVSSVRAMYLG